MSRKLGKALASLALAAAMVPVPPVLAGNGVPGGSLTALNGSPGASAQERYPSLTDMSNQSKWRTEGSKNWMGYTGDYFIFKADAAKTAAGYLLTTANDASSHPGANWKGWSLYGGNFASDAEAARHALGWNLIQTVTDDQVLQAVDKTRFEFSIPDNDTAYQYYKFEIQSIQQGTTMQMAELVMLWAGEEDYPWKQLEARVRAGGEVRLDQDYTAAYYDNCLTVPAGVSVVLDLNGHIIDRGLTDTQERDGTEYVIHVEKGGTLTVRDGSVSGAGRITGGGGTGIFNEGTLTLVSGGVSGNRGTSGGGIRNTGTLTVAGGVVSDNQAGSGGGVYNTGTLSLTGGTIADNACEFGDGGGVYLIDTGFFAVTGGSVTGNSASSGGGVFVSRYGDAVLTMEGSPDITGNTDRSGNDSNLYLDTGRAVLVTGALAGSVGVSMRQPGIFTVGLDEDSGTFVSDRPEYYTARNGEALLVKKAAPAVTPPEAAQSLSYTGAEQALILPGSAEGGTLRYSLDRTTYSEAVPTGADAGDYYVSYRVDGDAVHLDTEPQALTVSVAKAPIAPAVSASGWTSGHYDPEANQPAVTGNPGGGDVTFTWQDSEGIEVKNPASAGPGVYTVTAAVAETDNYLGGEASASVTVSPAYTVTWKNADGEVLARDAYVTPGTVPRYTGDAPTKAPDAAQTYTFAGWAPEPGPVTADTVYTAVFTGTPRRYTVKFVDNTGNEYSSAVYPYGTKAADIVQPQGLREWTPRLADVTQDATYQSAASATRAYRNGEEVAFDDVPSEKYYSDAVRWAVEEDILRGVSATDFQPYGSLTRAQFITFLWRAAGSPQAAQGKNPFTDVNPGMYYYEAALWAAEQGITKGTTATTFHPDRIVTRAQAVTFLYRLAGTEPGDDDSPFADVDQDRYYHDAVTWAYENGITTGRTGDTFQPGVPCSRAQAAAFLCRSFAEQGQSLTF